MSALDDLRTFQEALLPLCQERALACRVNLAETDPASPEAAPSVPALCLAQIRDELVWGRLVEAQQGGRFFVRVRTPFAISESLKFFRLRSYSLTLIARRPLAGRASSRSLEETPLSLDVWSLLEEALEAVLASSPPGSAFVQFESLAPLPAGQTALVACRAVFCAGELLDTVGTGGVKGDEAVALYVL